MNFEELCRRQMLRRRAAIRTAFELRQERLASVADSISNADRVDRDSKLRWARAQSATASER